MKYRVLETARLVLRDWRKEDAQDLYEYARNPEVGLWPDGRPIPTGSIRCRYCSAYMDVRRCMGYCIAGKRKGNRAAADVSG